MANSSPAALDALLFPAIGGSFGEVVNVYSMPCAGWYALPLLNRRKIAPVRSLWPLPMNC